jgi:hypothetical protein
MTKTGKGTGLSAFNKRPAEVEPATTNGKSRGAGDSVAITVRLSKANWIRLRNVVMDEGVSLQELAVRGFNRELKAKGLPPLDA